MSKVERSILVLLTIGVWVLVFMSYHQKITLNRISWNTNQTYSQVDLLRQKIPNINDSEKIQTKDCGYKRHDPCYVDVVNTFDFN